MVYFVSDIHGEYALFRALLKTIGFSAADELYICGDMIDKGPRSVALLKFIFPIRICIASWEIMSTCLWSIIIL